MPSQFTSNQTNTHHVFGAKVEFFSPVDFYDDATFQKVSFTDLTVSNTFDSTGTASVKEVFEKVHINSEDAGGYLHIDVNNGSLHNYTQNFGTNFTLNVRADSKTTLDSVMKNGTSLVITLMIPMGGSAFYLSDASTTGFKIDGTAQSVKWILAQPPNAGFIDSINSYTFAIIKNSKDNYTVLGSLSRFG